MQENNQWLAEVCTTHPLVFNVNGIATTVYVRKLTRLHVDYLLASLSRNLKR